MTSVLIVVAHPDDAEIAMGMRIRWYAHNGAHVRVHCLTTGSSPAANGGDVRRRECLAAGAVLGVKKYSFSDLPDTSFTDHRGDINADLSRVFGRERPDIVYTHYPKDQHLDHIATAQEVTAVALREAADLTYFRSPYTLGFEPNEILIGTADLLGVKEIALRHFESQGQLDMTSFTRLAQITHQQHLHHRVLKRLPPQAVAAELFVIARHVEIAVASGGGNNLDPYADHLRCES